MNYQSFPKEFTLISKKILRIFQSQQWWYCWEQHDEKFQQWVSKDFFWSSLSNTQTLNYSRMTTLKVFELPEEYLMEFKSEIIIIDTPCDSLSNELYEISI